MKLLIAGWHGQVAKALMQAATNAPDVRGVAAVRPALDPRDPNSLERTFRDQSPTIAINTAAYTNIDAAEDDPDPAFALNTEGARRFARAASRRNIPVIHLSTHYVFDGAGVDPYGEDETPSPSTVYGRSKHEGECAVASENPQHIILRTGWIYSGVSKNFATRILEKASRGDPLKVVADQTGNPMYAPHLADFILELARLVEGQQEKANIPWGTYHVPGSGTTTWHGLATKLVAAFGENGHAPNIAALNSDDYPCRAPRPANSTLNAEKCTQAFGLKLPPWEEGVEDCVKAFKAQQATENS